MKSLRRLARFLKPYKWESLMALVLLFGLVAVDLAIPRLTQRIIDDGVAQRDLQVVVSTSLIMVAVSVLSASLSIANTVLSVRVGLGAATDLRSELVRKVQTFSFGNLDRIQTGHLLVRATSDINQVQMVVMMALRIFLRAPLWVLGSAVMLTLTSGRLALLMLALIPVVLVLVWLFAFRARRLYTIVQKKLDRLNQVMQENLAGVRVVKAFVRVKYENARFEEANSDLTAQAVRVAQLFAMLFPTMMLTINLGTAGVIWFGGNLVVDGAMTVGEIMASVFYLSRSLFPLLMLGGMMSPLAAAEASAQRILEVLDSTPEVQNRPEARAMAEVKGRVAFEDVTFSYGGDSREPVLKGVNLVAEPGQTVAILGATGSGKSSLVHMIPRFYDVTGGRVTLDGVDVRDLSLEALRAQMSVALQDTVLFSGTVRDNIRYGCPDATDALVIAAAKAAQAHDFISAFPDGYDALVEQRGVNLSGGQKQRIAIARALLVDPKVLILDDSTSSVDVETETKIQDALDNLMADRTSFVIAQRISTVLNADKIVVLDQGRVAAEGTHAGLMMTSPIYQEIYESQLGDGRPNNG